MCRVHEFAWEYACILMYIQAYLYMNAYIHMHNVLYTRYKNVDMLIYRCVYIYIRT